MRISRDNLPDFRLCLRTIQLDLLTSFLYWLIERHIEHHMFVGAPCYNLDRLSLEIADDMPAPRSLLDAWREMRNACGPRERGASLSGRLELAQSAQVARRSPRANSASLVKRSAKMGARWT